MPSALVLVGFVLAAAAGGQQAVTSADIVLVQDGVALEVPADVAGALASGVVAYFETCRTYQAVTGDTPSQESLLERWEELKRRAHAIVTLESADTDASREQQLLVGFSPDSPAWPVLTRDPSGFVILYSKCDGLEGLLLACDVGELIPAAAPRDCEWLRSLPRRQGGSE